MTAGRPQCLPRRKSKQIQSVKQCEIWKSCILAGHSYHAFLLLNSADMTDMIVSAAQEESRKEQAGSQVDVLISSISSLPVSLPACSILSPDRRVSPASLTHGVPDSLPKKLHFKLQDEERKVSE